MIYTTYLRECVQILTCQAKGPEGAYVHRSKAAGQRSPHVAPPFRCTRSKAPSAPTPELQATTESQISQPALPLTAGQLFRHNLTPAPGMEDVDSEDSDG